MSLVLDASALLAYLHEEPGADRVRDVLDGGRVSSVNWCEVAQKVRFHGGDPAQALADLRTLGVVVEPFTESQADQAAELWERTRHKGLSLADRACLGLAIDRSTPVLTADKIWVELGLDVNVRLLR